MASKKTRRTVLALAILAAPLGLAAAGSPASADTLYPRLSTGGCITGIADTVKGQPVCRVIGTSSGVRGSITIVTDGELGNIW
jgi:hypothetical protein